MKTLKQISAKSNYNDEKDHFGTKAKPCSCGSTELELVEVNPPRVNDAGKQIYPARVAIQCTKCKSCGIDTCHGEEHAIRRWNWFHQDSEKDHGF